MRLVNKIDLKLSNGLPVKGEFAKNAFTLSVGTSIAQTFPIIIYPILSRVFTPVQFGVLATLSSITSILAIIATGNYESSILIAPTKKDAANIIGLILILSTTFLVFSSIGLYVISNQLSIWFNEPDLKIWLFVCPLSAFVIVIYNCYNEWCVRNKYFVKLSINKIINAGATTLGKLLFGIVKTFSNGLIIGDLLGRFISAAGCVIRAWGIDKSEFRQITRNKMVAMAERYVNFPRLSLPAQLINTIGGAIPVLMISAYFGSIEVGYYSMTLNILSVPLSIISLSIKDTFRQRASEEFAKTGSCARIYQRLLKYLVIGGILGSILLFFALPEIFSIALGKQWRIAGQYSQILMPMIAINFVCTSLSGVLIIAEKMRTIFLVEIYYTTVTVVSLLLGCLVFKDIILTLICFAVGRSSAYLLNILLSYKHSKGILK
jgi:O-antigen/teichoic acid export membrane protein